MYLFLFLFWLLLNGKVSLEICLFGVGIVAAVAVLAYLLFGYTPKRDILFLRRIPAFMLYVFVLIWEVLKANFRVIGIIWNTKKNLKQSLVIVDPGLKTGFARFVLANSITLTPGTITVKADGRKFVVHCLDRDMIAGIEDGLLCKILRKMEKMEG